MSALESINAPGATNAPVRLPPLSARSTKPLVRSLEKWRLRIYLVLLLADFASVICGFGLAHWIYLGAFPAGIISPGATLLLPILPLIELYQGAYSIKALASLKFSIRRSALALIVSYALLVFIAFYTKSTDSFSRVAFALAFVFIMIQIVISRILLIKFIRHLFGPTMSNVLVIEDSGPEVHLRNAIHINAEEHGLAPDTSDPHRLDRLGRYLLNMDRVVVSCPINKRMEWTFALRASGVRGEVVSTSLQELSPIDLEIDGDCISLVVSTGPLGARARAIKRLMDLSISILAVMALSPIFLLIAVAIKLQDGGPVFFLQHRVGRGNRLFEVFKFRSMRAEAADAGGQRSASREDDRITPVGRLLRRTSLDELPQLLNVVRGEMSLVGPRPHALGSQAGDKLFWVVDKKYWNRHSLRPGLTGLAQVRGFRGATDHENDLRQRLQADLEYINSWSPLNDIVIILKTVGVLVHDRAF